MAIYHMGIIWILYGYHLERPGADQVNARFRVDCE